MILMLWLVLCTGLNLIVIPTPLVVLLGVVWLLLDCMLVGGICIKISRNNSDRDGSSLQG